MTKKPNFTGYATKYGVLCSDGRTIVADAFKMQHEQRLPLLWRHDDSSPENILGHVILKHEAGVGIKCDAYFNPTERGEHSRITVEHGDIDALSIKAVRLQQSGTNVTGGKLTEVSLVPHGANKEARIESVYLEHSDGDIEEVQNAGIIFSGLSLSHGDKEDEEDEDDEDDKAKPKGKPEDDEDNEDDDEEDEAKHSDSELDVQKIYDSMSDEQKLVNAILINAASNSAAHSDSDESGLTQEGENMSNTRNVFDQAREGAKGPEKTLTHAEIEEIFDKAMSHETGKFSDHVLTHADPYGITNIAVLFPDAKPVTDRPEWIKRDDSWVAGVLAGVKKSPFSKIKSWTADVTHEDARAKGYIKGTMKKDEYYAIAQRETTPTTIYKKQKLDRDDIIDVSTFDVVIWMKDEMRWMLQEETARAILFGDGRDPGDPDKVKAINIRPIAYDDDFYTTKVLINANLATKSLATKILRSRKFLKGGTSKPTLYTNDDLIIDLLLMEDQLGRRYYETEQALAAALGVKNIVECDVLDEGYVDTAGNQLLGVMVHIGDYTVGADKGGQTSMFEDFDIDFNQHKYLIEHRLSGALTRHHSAISLWTSGAARILPEEPTITATNKLTIPDQIGVTYVRRTLGNEDVDISGTVVDLTAANTPFKVVATAEVNYRFPLNVTTEWIFTWTDPEA